MVTPETGEAEIPAKTSARWKVPAALLTAVAGVATVFALTAPEPPPSTENTIPTGTTVAGPEAPTTTVEFVAQGEALAFEVHELDGLPLALMETATGELLLARGSVGPTGIRTVELLTSVDGSSWAPVGDPIGPPDRVSGVEVTGVGLVAFGHDASGTPTTWVTDDGRQWTRTPIDSTQSAEIYTLGAVPDLMVTYGFTGGWYSLEAALIGRLGDFGSRFNLERHGSSPPTAVVHSPLGIALAEYTMDELGIDPDLFDAPDEREVFATMDGVEWYEATLPDTPDTWSAPRFFVGDDDQLWLASQQNFNTLMFSTTDGLEWIRRGDIPMTASVAIPWRGGLIAGGYDLRVLTSSDGDLQEEIDEWEEISARNLFTNPGDWYLSAWDAGDAGLALVVQNTRSTAPGPPPEDPVVEFEVEGMVLRVTPDRIMVLEDGEVRANFGRWLTTVPDGVSFDSEAGTVTISGSDGTHLITLGFDDLTRMESEAASATEEGFAPVGKQVLLTSVDGVVWTSQELQLPGPFSTVYSVDVTAGRVILSVADISGRTDAQLLVAPMPDAQE